MVLGNYLPVLPPLRYFKIIIYKRKVHFFLKHSSSQLEEREGKGREVRGLECGRRDE
jgi:hypothetical protein